jgi:sialate O-acetylesterase
MNAYFPRLVAMILTLSACTAPAGASVRLPRIFSDHMVLQAGQAVPVWGTADAGEKITVRLADQTKTAEASPDGKWRVTLNKLTPAEGLTLKIEAGNELTFTDVLIGEVWLCSGQSNMALAVSKAADFDRERPNAKWPKIRTFTTKWIECSPETVGNFSAVGYYFGREIHQKTGLAVGLINRSAGGSPIELWTSLDAQKSVPELAPILGDSQEATVESKSAAQAESDRKQALEVEGKQATAAQKRPPGYLFEDRIVPLIPYAIRGVVWYQGEANSYTVHADLYGRQLATMITDWRKRWGYDFAFLTVQLPELGRAQTEPVEDSGRAFVRDGVLQSLSLPNTGMAVTLGTGEANNNHPKNKQEVGRRLALWALSQVYGKKKDQPASGPLPAGHTIIDGKIVITFNHVAGGLKARGGELKGFAIAGEDGKWRWAQAKINGDKVIVWHPDVKEPSAARYAWAGNPADCSLGNDAGLPASPFQVGDSPRAQPIK